MKVDWYECTSEACMDNGGTCLLAVPSGCAPPSSCTTPLEAVDAECEWVKVTKEKAKEFYS